jgi:hypothetical protein
VCHGSLKDVLQTWTTALRVDSVHVVSDILDREILQADWCRHVGVLSGVSSDVSRA